MTRDRRPPPHGRAAGSAAWRARPLVAAGTVVVAAVYLAGSLFPFQFDVPRRVRNTAERTGAEVVFPGTGIVTQPPVVDTSLADALPSGELLVDVVVVAEPDQQGPARILSLSSGVWEQSLVLGQYDSSLEVRVRRPGSSDLGTPPASLKDALAGGGDHRILVAIDRSSIVVTVDGVERWRDEAVDALSTFDPRHRIVLGNEHGGNARGTDASAVRW